MKRDIFLFGKAEEDARLAPCYDDNAAKRKKSRFNAWFAFNTAGYPGGSIMDREHFRTADENDVGLILRFIRELAEYEGLADEVVADEETLREWIFGKKKAEVIFALENGQEVGFALFFHNFSTFLGRAGIYLEDLYVRPEYRGKGYGKGLIRLLAAIAVERGCGRLEWWCLDRNKPSVDFYLSLGAQPMDEWTTYRFEGKSLYDLAEG